MAFGARPGCGDRPRNIDSDIPGAAGARAHARAAGGRHIDRADRDAAARSLDRDAVGAGAGACGGGGSRHIHADAPVTAAAHDENRSTARGADCLRADGNLVAASIVVLDMNSAGIRRSSVGRHQPGGADGDGPAAAAVDVNPGAGLRADRNGHNVDVAAAAGIRHVNSAAVHCGAHGGHRAARPHLDIARSGVVRMQRASARHAHIARLDIQVAAAAGGGDSVAALRRSRRGDGTGRNQPDVRGPVGCDDNSAAARRADDAGRDVDVSSAAADRDNVAVCGGSRGGDRPRHLDVNAAGSTAFDAQAASASRDRAVHLDADIAARRHVFDKHSVRAGAASSCDIARHANVDGAGAVIVDKDPAPALGSRILHRNVDIALGLLPHFDRMGVVVAALGDKVLCGNRDIRVSDTASQKDRFVPSALAGDASRRCD